MKPTQSLTALATILALALGAPLAATAETHSHDGHDAATMELVLNEGAKWQGDQNMRDGMAAIHDAMTTNFDAIHDGTLSADGARALAGEVQKQVDFMVENCVLEPATDEQFHIVLGGILTGTGDLEEGQVEAGAATIVKTLNAYGTHFEHPDWQVIE